jgi:hypothetical protein
MKLAIFSCISGFKIVSELDFRDSLKCYPEDLTVILEEDIEVLNYQPFFVGFQTDGNQKMILGDGRLLPSRRKNIRYL